jgi:hypothetical protein
VETLFAAIEASSIAEYLRDARWGYAALNATHILGIALLIGSVLPLDMRLLGLWSDISRSTLARVLVPTATTGLVVAVSTGALLFSIRASEYASTTIVQAKLALIALGAGSALAVHWRYGLYFQRTDQQRLAGPALLSMGCWLGALICGRLIAFADN